MKKVFKLINPSVRKLACHYINSAPDDYMVTVGDATRTLEQNAKLHVICEDLEKSGLAFAGKPRSKYQWKVLLISGHAVATGLPAEIVPGLEGEFVNIRESSAQMGKKRMSSVIEYALAFCAMNGVKPSNQDCGL